MTEYVMSINGRMLPDINRGFVAWRQGTGEAAELQRMTAGDYIVPKFAQTAFYGDDDSTERAIFERLGDNFDEVRKQYVGLVAGGASAVPYVLVVTGPAQEDNSTGEAGLKVPIHIEKLKNPLSTKMFLRLRALPDEVAAQFKATVSPGRHIQEVQPGLVAAVRSAGSTDDPEPFLRKYSLVEAQTVETAASLLTDVGRPPREGDRAFLVTRAMMPGIAKAVSDGELLLEHEPIAQPPDQIRPLLEDAQRRAKPNVPFTPQPALAAADELLGFLDADEKVRAVDDFARFYDRYQLLTRKVTQALSLRLRPLPEKVSDEEPGTSEPEGAEELENPDIATALAGLSIEAVEAALPDGFFIDRNVIAACVTALRAGKHLLLGGPPGTGKTTLGEALCRAVVGQGYQVTTATADWTTFDTIGGYLPSHDTGLRFSPGVVLRALRDSSWLLIDEVNRADIDKAFGPLFTVLSGGEGSATRRAVLPYMMDAKQVVTIEWTNSPKSPATYPLTPSWRLIGTLNVSDKASLFRLSFAFLRRFAVIDVPLPSDADYRKLFESWFQDAPDEARDSLVESSLRIANGPIPIGPAIGRDLSLFVLQAISPTSSGKAAFDSPQEALLTGVQLLVVPQYEGAPIDDGRALARIVKEVLPGVALESHGRLKTALEEVALK